jgi:hypothetical protein
MCNFRVHNEPMRYLVSVFLFCSFLSCNYFEKKKLDSNTILMEELKTFNWNEVDRYPSFENCTDSIDYQDSKMCFEQMIMTHISEYFRLQDLVVTQKVSDTIKINFLVSNKGEIHISKIHSKALTKIEIPNLDSIIDYSLKNLPPLYPAIKRSQQVQSAFELPLILVVN